MYINIYIYIYIHIYIQHTHVQVVAYIYFTRIVVALVEATLPYDLIWLQTLFDEGATLAFYAVTVRGVWYGCVIMV